jgi:NADH-quinone oxidoreductase subunit J
MGLLFTLFGVAGLYALLAADFLAITQIMVYIGGILTLIIFGVMLTSRVTDIEKKVNVMGNVSVVAGVILAVASAAFLSYVFVSTK